MTNGAAVTPTLDGFTITGARSDNHGGGLRPQDSDALIRNNVITGNVAYFLGGGVWVQRGAPRFENNQVTPSGTAYGGGIELEGTRTTLVGNLIAGNVIRSARLRRRRGEHNGRIPWCLTGV